MNARCCSEIDSRVADREAAGASARNSVTQRPAFNRRYIEIGRWAVPSAILAILPKCPACLAAYVAIGTGIGLSESRATYLRMLLVILCAGSLIYLAARRLNRLASMKEWKHGSKI
jgi:hypothetical protein